MRLLCIHTHLREYEAIQLYEYIRIHIHECCVLSTIRLWQCGWYMARTSKKRQSSTLRISQRLLFRTYCIIRGMQKFSDIKKWSFCWKQNHIWIGLPSVRPSSAMFRTMNPHTYGEFHCCTWAFRGPQTPKIGLQSLSNKAMWGIKQKILKSIFRKSKTLLLSTHCQPVRLTVTRTFQRNVYAYLNKFI